ncbi:MAG: hypothetical protein JOZ55_04130, partial [Alphaproteobacteria bacterium]|nr:hypothetical protein [Alphaproteobacteria bacterium]
SSGDFIQNNGVLKGGAVDIVAAGNILIGEKAFTDATASRSPSQIDQAGTPYFLHSAAFDNHVFINTQSLSLRAPDRIVIENTGNQPTAPNYAPNGFGVTHTGSSPPAILIGGAPQVVDLFGTLTQNGTAIPPKAVASTSVVEFAPGTVASNNYRINGCVVHQTGSCTIVSFNFEDFEPAKLSELVLAPASNNDDVEDDLTITGAGNDEIWEEQ